MIQRKYTEAQGIEEAKRIQALPANKEPYTVYTQIKETMVVPEVYIDNVQRINWHSLLFINWRNIKWIPVKMTRQVQRQQIRTVAQVAYRDRPLEYFAGPLREQSAESA